MEEQQVLSTAEPSLQPSVHTIRRKLRIKIGFGETPVCRSASLCIWVGYMGNTSVFLGFELSNSTQHFLIS